MVFQTLLREGYKKTVPKAVVKYPSGKYPRTQEQRLAQSHRAQKQEHKKDTFRYEGKTYHKSEGVKAFYKTDRTISGTAYSWVPKSVRGGKGGGIGNPKQIEERKLIKSKLQELDVEELKGMYGPDLVKYIKNTLNLERHPSALQPLQREIIGGGWKIGKGQRGSAGPDHFTYRGKVYPKSEGVVTTYPGIGTAGTTIKKWTPKEVKGTVGKHKNRYMDPALIAERESIRTAFEKMDKKILKRMTGNELLAASNKIPGVNRNTIPYDIREQVIGGGWKPKKGRTLVEGQLARFSGINSLSPENFTKVGEFLSMLSKAYPKKKSSATIKPIVDRMIKFAKRKGVPEEQIMKKLYETDIEGMGDIIIKNHELKKLWKEADDLGLKPELIDLSHIEAVSRNWEKALDPSNLVFANEKSNRYLQKSIEEQIQILRKYIPQAKSLADKKMIAQQKIVLDPTKRKEHMYEYYKPRTLEEMKKDLAEANLVSEIGGTRRGAKIDPNDPYFSDQISKDLRERIFGEQWSQAGGMAGGGIIKSILNPKISRRKFLKGMGATVASAALPGSRTLAAPSVKSLMERRLSFAPPWVAKMTSALNLAVNKKGITKLPNGTKIEYIKGPHTKYDSHKLSVKTADGNEDLVNFKETKDSLEIEFDIRDEWHNNQHIHIDKKNKTAELIDENYYMTSPEDYAKDDPIIWDIDKKSLDKTIILDKSVKADDYIYDYMSTPDGSDYSYLFERYIDSFSPAGSIFKTKEYAKQLRKKEALDKRAQEDRSMADWEEQFRGGHGMHAYKDGGLTKTVPPTKGPASNFVTEGVEMIKANPQKFVFGGLVKKYAPKVLGTKSAYLPKLTGKGPDLSRVRSDIYEAPKGPYTITDESGVRILDTEFKDLSAAQKALDELATLRTQDASTFKIFGKRPPKTAEGVSEGAPEVNLGMVGREIPKEKPAAMFWGSREKIIDAPSEAMDGSQWLRYLQLGKHGILNPKGYPIIKHAELNDTGLAPYLSKNKDKMLSKEQLVKDFDSKLAPEIEVISLGKVGAERDADKLYRTMNKMDMQEYREGPLKNVLMGVRNRAYPLKEAIGNNNKDAVLKIVDEIEKLTFDNLGVANSIKEGFPQKFPFELKNILQRISQISGARTTGFKKYTKDVQYRGQQTLGGGENYREFLFKYKHPSGSLRETEPMTKYSDLGGNHFSSLSSKDQTGGFVHTRISDRTDEFGRRILHIEEIQSDMHQQINAAARRVKRAEAEGKRTSPGDIKKSKYAPRGDLVAAPTDVANEQQLGLILSKIEDLASQPMTKQTQIRLNRLNKERTKIRKIIADKRAKMAEGDHSGIPMGPLRKSEDYNEFVMKYMTKVAQEGGYDGVTISSGAIKNRGESAGSIDWKGNMVAYGPIAEGAMKKVAKKTGAKFIRTAIIDDNGRGWSVPMIWLDDAAKFTVQKGMPIYRKGGMVING